MDSHRTWAVRFEYDRESDIVYVFPCGDVATAADSQAFNEECNAYYSSFGHKIDVIVVLEMWGGSPTYTPDMAGLSRSINRMVVVAYGPVDIVRVAKVNAEVGQRFHLASDTNSAVAMLREMRTRDNGRSP